MSKLSVIVLAISTIVICSVSVLAQQRTVAMTFDDLPVAGTMDPSEAQDINETILEALDRHHVPAIGFVIGKRVKDIGETQGKDVLGEWVQRGYDLGNHTYSHTSFNGLTVEQFKEEILKGEGPIADALSFAGKTARYFRFPANQTGDTREKHDQMAAFLHAQGYRLAVCTIDNQDYVFNVPYLKMLAGKDDNAATRLRADYLAYTSKEIDYYAGLHRQIFGREIPHVMLLHVNRLNADVIDDLLSLFEQKQYRFVTLENALSDDAYETPDTFATQYGLMWAYRWAKEMAVRVNGALESEPPEWVLQYGKELEE